jgi:hypothetical protein
MTDARLEPLGDARRRRVDRHLPTVASLSRVVLANHTSSAAPSATPCLSPSFQLTTCRAQAGQLHCLRSVRAGQEVLTVQGVMPRGAGADINGFSLHAAVRCGADER